MSKVRADKTVYDERIVTQEGEVVSSKTVIKSISEPEYVKLYIDCLFTVKGLRKGLNPIFIAFLRHMSYADVNARYGGQLIYTNKALKMQIAEQLHLGIDSINKALSEFVKAGVFKRVAVGTYQVNPDIVGRGEWKDIKNIKATFDFAEKSVKAEIVKAEEGEIDSHTEQLEEQYAAATDPNQMTFEEVERNVELSREKDSSKAG